MYICIYVYIHTLESVGLIKMVSLEYLQSIGLIESMYKAIYY